MSSRSQDFDIMDEEEEDEEPIVIPEWYTRLVINQPGRDVEPEDFDDDISELGEGEEERIPYKPLDDEYSNYGDHDSVTASEDELESETGIDAVLYHKYRDLRIQRKIELRDAKVEEEERNSLREFEGGQAAEVQAVYRAMLKAKRNGNLDRQRLSPFGWPLYNIFSVDHVDHCMLFPPHRLKSVEFHYDEFPRDLDRPRNPKVISTGQIYLESGYTYQFKSFRWLTRAGPEKRRFETTDSDKVDIQFLNKKYLILTVAKTSKMIQDVILPSQAEDAPDKFTFYGILETWDET